MAWYLILVLGILIGVVIGMFVSRYTMKGYLKKHSPINEDMLKQLASSMGRNLSQKQLNQMMKQFSK